ncbi:MAG: nucleoside deaminase [Candidatus Kariarchaeaceae archaeon]|jgi:cytosine deaminase
MDKFMEAAIQEAKLGISEGGMPIGSVLVLDGKIVGRGRNLRHQKGSVILHAEMDAIENTGRLTPEEYERSTIYTTLSPCQMCSGTIVYLNIKTVIMAENETVKGAEDFLLTHGVKLINLDLNECKILMKEYVPENA